MTIPSSTESRSAVEPKRFAALRLVVSVIALLVIYYALPSGEQTTPGLVVSLSAVAIAAGVLGWAIFSQVSRHLRDPDARLASLAMLLAMAIFLFAYSYYRLAIARPEEFVDLRTQTDALYFTLATLSTVGFGDVHADGQLARALVSAQMVFNVVVIGTAVSTLSSGVRRRAGRREQAQPLLPASDGS